MCPPRGIAIDVTNCLVALFYGCCCPSEYSLKLEEASYSFFTIVVVTAGVISPGPVVLPMDGGVYRTLNKIKQKLLTNNALALKADKGNSVVIIYADGYHNKFQDFITNNSFTIVHKHPTKQFQNKIRITIKEYQETIHKGNKTKYTNLNLTAHAITGLPKVHEENCPIAPE